MSNNWMVDPVNNSRPSKTVQMLRNALEKWRCSIRPVDWIGISSVRPLPRQIFSEADRKLSAIPGHSRELNRTARKQTFPPSPSGHRTLEQIAAADTLTPVLRLDPERLVGDGVANEAIASAGEHVANGAVLIASYTRPEAIRAPAPAWRRSCRSLPLRLRRQTCTT